MGHYSLIGLSSLLLICSVYGNAMDFYIRGRAEGIYTVPGVEGYFQNVPFTGEHIYVNGQGNVFVYLSNNMGAGDQRNSKYPPQIAPAFGVQPIGGGNNQYQPVAGAAINPYNGPYNTVPPHQNVYYRTNSYQQQNQVTNQNQVAFPPQQQYTRATNIPQIGYPAQVGGNWQYPPVGAQLQKQPLPLGVIQQTT